MNPGASANAPDLCDHFQVDLSCMLDGELDEVAAGRAMLHIEACPGCRSFFEDTRACVRMHRDMSDPDQLVARLSILFGSDLRTTAEAVGLVNRLSTIFYQLGKAYVLAAIDPDYRTRIFEAAVPVESTQSGGRAFVDDVLQDGQSSCGGVDWRHARSMLNGELKQIKTPIEKGRRLLHEALEADPTHEEARLYLAFLSHQEGKSLQAAQEYRRIFRTALDPKNRGHAAVQLGRLHAAEGNYKKAIACFRWITASGLADQEERFFFARFNIGMDYAFLGDQGRSLAAFRELLDRHPGRASEVTDMFARSPRLQSSIESKPGFPEALYEACPELFERPAETGTPGHG